jgi:hypothetical protein
LGKPFPDEAGICEEPLEVRTQRFDVDKGLIDIKDENR